MKDRPWLALAAGFAAGLLVGMLLPVTRFESERLGPIAEDLKERAREAGGAAIRKGSEAIKDSIEAGREAAVETMRENVEGFRYD